MKSNEILDRFNELNKNNNICCTDKELESFLVSGLIFKSGDNYITKNLKPISVEVVKPKELDFDIQLSDLISICENKAKELSINRIYCMSQRCYNKYKQQGFIINKDNNSYYRMFDKELWLVYLMN